MTMGQNVVAGDSLRAFVERIERIREEKKAFVEDEKVCFAEAKAAGFTLKTLRAVLKIRAARPHDWQEFQSELDMYLAALGMAEDAPLFRAVGLMKVDTAAREQVIDAVKLLVPADGEIILKVGGAPVRLWRDETEAVHVEDWVEPKAPPPAAAGVTAPARPEPPDVDDEGARMLGLAAYTKNQPVTSNPFPYGDLRRAQFDAGWRESSGSDGMGPRDPDDGDDAE